MMLQRGEKGFLDRSHKHTTFAQDTFYNDTNNSYNNNRSFDLLSHPLSFSSSFARKSAIKKTVTSNRDRKLDRTATNSFNLTSKDIIRKEISREYRSIQYDKTYVYKYRTLYVRGSFMK